jgi:hypothetical protein
MTLIFVPRPASASLQVGYPVMWMLSDLFTTSPSFVHGGSLILKFNIHFVCLHRMLDA